MKRLVLVYAGVVLGMLVWEISTNHLASICRFNTEACADQAVTAFQHAILWPFYLPLALR